MTDEQGVPKQLGQAADADNKTEMSPEQLAEVAAGNAPTGSHPPNPGTIEISSWSFGAGNGSLGTGDGTAPGKVNIP